MFIKIITEEATSAEIEREREIENIEHPFAGDNAELFSINPDDDYFSENIDIPARL